MSTIRSFAVTWAVPAFAAGYLPYALNVGQTLELGVLRHSGWLPIAVGIFLFGIHTWNLLIKDKTIAIKNPGYLAALCVVFGQAVRLSSGEILVSALLLCSLFHLVIVVLKEPDWQKRNSTRYRSYATQLDLTTSKNAA